MLSGPEVKKGYDELEEEFALFEEILKARLRAGKMQEWVAKTLHTTSLAISKLENSGGRKHYSSTIETLRKYAKAIECNLQITFVPSK
jgi:DNA-binding XRE family transcriptional regulator